MTLSNFGRVTPTSCQQTVGSQSSARQAERARVYGAKNKQMNWRQNVGLGSVLDLDIVMFLRQVDCCCPVGLSPRRVCSALKIHHKKKTRSSLFAVFWQFKAPWKFTERKHCACHLLVCGRTV